MDAIDYRIIDQLRQNARAGYGDIGDEVGLSASAVKRRVDKLVAEYAEVYAVVPELLPDGDRHEALRYGARVEIGLRSFLEAAGAQAFTTNFEDLGGLRQLRRARN